MTLIIVVVVPVIGWYFMYKLGYKHGTNKTIMVRRMHGH